MTLLQTHTHTQLARTHNSKILAREYRILEDRALIYYAHRINPILARNFDLDGPIRNVSFLPLGCLVKSYSSFKLQLP